MPKGRTQEQVVQAEIIDLLAQIEDLLQDVRTRVETPADESDG